MMNGDMDKIEKKLDEYIQSVRPPTEMRKLLDIGYRIEKQSIYIFERRPRYDNPEIYLEMDNFKATRVKSRGVWKIYWMRADLKWHPYDPAKEVRSFKRVLEIYDEDAYGCFKG